MTRTVPSATSPAQAGNAQRPAPRGIRRVQRRESAPLVPGARLLGSLLRFSSDPLGELRGAMERQGDVVRFRLGTPGAHLVIYGVFHPDGVAHVLQDGRGRYTKDRFYDEMAAAFGRGLVTSRGDTWRRQRRIIQPAFHRTNLARFVPVVVSEAEALLSCWERVADRGEAIDVHRDMEDLSLGVATRALFGRDVDRIGKTIAAEFPGLSERIFSRGFALVKAPLGAPTAANRRFRRALARVDEAVEAIVDDRRRAGGEGHTDLLAGLIAARDEATGLPMDRTQLRDEVLTMISAAFETTAAALAFSLLLLARHPEVLEGVAREADAVLVGRPPAAEDLPRLRYTTQVFKEAMRLYPPAWGMSRISMVEDEIGGHPIPPRTNVFVSPWATHRHPRFWSQPDHFDPERFTPEAERARHRFAYFPFGIGQRMCVGAQLAMLEGVCTLAMIARRARIRPDPSHRIELEPHITLRTRTGVRLFVEPR